MMARRLEPNREFGRQADTRKGRRSRPRALLFDALGTLLALEPPAPRLRAELERRCGVVVSETEAERALVAEIAYYRAHMGDGRDQASLLDLRGRCAEVLRSALPDSPRLAAVTHDQITDVLLASLRFRAFPDARPAIEMARRRRLRIAVVSNWDVSLPVVLATVGLGDGLDAVLTSAGVGRRKPDPAIFTAALERLGVPAADAIHVGDSFVEDIEGARAAGLRAVLIRRPDAPPAELPPDDVLTIPGLAGLATVI
jgi:putative hydrolase of the HAD superfamily